MNSMESESQYPTPFAKKSLVFVLFKLLFTLQVQKHSPNTKNTLLPEYDYIVVGAGPGGSTVASRLSENVCVSILLLEAGKSPPLLTEVPAISRSFVGTDIDWNYYTDPQKYTGQSLINRQVFIPSGKALGGSSIFNNMMYVRGSRLIYDQWAAGGATGWGYRDVLPYFKKSEINRNPESIDIPYHGFTGPMNVERPVFTSPYKSAIEAAIFELGYPKRDVNGRYDKGFFDFQANMRYGQRCSAAKAYLVPAENRNNLDIVKNAFVTKVIIQNKNAVGVQFDRFGQTFVVGARREVILSAGAVNTAQLLMLSGIGPKEHLEEMNIPIIADLPVGLNLHDHCATYRNYYTDILQPFSEEIISPPVVEAYIRRRTGLLSSPTGRLYMAFLTINRDASSEKLPDYQLFFQDSSSASLKTSYNLRREVYEQWFGPYENKSTLLCIAQPLNPRSRGTVKLRSANAYDSPIIDPNYLSNPQDLSDMIQAMKECDRIVNTRAFHNLGVKPYETLVPGCENYVQDQDAYYACQARQFIVTIGHLVGTAKMGSSNDSSTVVDHRLRVKGIEKLRVVDASVIPRITAGNTISPVLMIAEKAADIIKDDIYCN